MAGQPDKQGLTYGVPTIGELRRRIQQHVTWNQTKNMRTEMQRSEDIKIKAFGERAPFVCDVPTPSAAVGIAEAIYWRPGLHWRVTRIEVLKPSRHLSITAHFELDGTAADNVPAVTARIRRRLGLRDEKPTKQKED